MPARGRGGAAPLLAALTRTAKTVRARARPDRLGASNVTVTIADIVETIYLSNADTLMAWAFRRAVGCPAPAGRGGWSRRADADRYDGVGACFENRERVLL